MKTIPKMKHKKQVKNRPAFSSIVFPFARDVKSIESLFPETVTQFISQRAEVIGDAKCKAQYSLIDALGTVKSEETESYDDVDDALSFLKFYLSIICLNTDSKWSVAGDTLEAIYDDGGVTRMRIWKSQPDANNE